MRSEDLVMVDGHGRMLRREAVERTEQLAVHLANNPLNVKKWKEGLAFAEAARGLADQ